MIAADQPTIFSDDVIAAVSSMSDGNMRFNRGNDDDTFQNRLAFLHAVGIDPAQATLVQVVYEDASGFARYQVMTDEHKGEGMFAPQSTLVADALVSTRPGHALFLPLADCAGLVIYDPKSHVLMVSHIGRHSAEIDGARRSIEYLTEQCGSQPGDLQVWISPAVGSATYPLRSKNGRSLHDVVGEQLQAAGVPASQCEFSSVDTALDSNYFSHSQFLAKNQATDGRFAVVAQMR